MATDSVTRLEQKESTFKFNFFYILGKIARSERFIKSVFHCMTNCYFKLQFKNIFKNFLVFFLNRILNNFSLCPYRGSYFYGPSGPHMHPRHIDARLLLTNHQDHHQCNAEEAHGDENGNFNEEMPENSMKIVSLLLNALIVFVVTSLPEIPSSILKTYVMLNEVEEVN
ncbi:hypothetical protein EGR_08221 [Echinococcus granulosus]|uniref:Uncharacterized protein n=1 Tax=Echinococcus granulosus TaxID=6210 RepID=W6U6S6_ECHGR|nr:hypothetical protein EGR_08221 [Echinococcus granulosus]EUB56915.1 hypothetical protein EGR_08221 [Echinococcus granulosus]